MAKIFFSFAVFVFLFILINGMMWNGMNGVEAIRHKEEMMMVQNKHKHKHINCSSNIYCDPFGPKIDLRCKDSQECQERCNQFDGVFLCSVQHGYCKCQTDT
ncbi:unnamed protein product [Amaranthus hypochondriacus]